MWFGSNHHKICVWYCTCKMFALSFHFPAHSSVNTFTRASFSCNFSCTFGTVNLSCENKKVSHVLLSQFYCYLTLTDTVLRSFTNKWLTKHMFLTDFPPSIILSLSISCLSSLINFTLGSSFTVGLLMIFLVLLAYLNVLNVSA